MYLFLTENSKLKFNKGDKYNYDYNVEVLSGVSGTSEKQTSFLVTSKIYLESFSECEAELTVSGFA